MSVPDAETPIAKARQSNYLPTLDGWRALAILIVILSHDNTHHLAGLSTAWFNANGHTGVDLFFALSGILICTRLLAEERATGTISLKKFYLRRIFRIQPAAFFYLAVVTALMLCGALDHAFAGVADAIFLARNYLPVHASPADWYTGHFWSLSVEEHFYLLLPGALLVFRKHRVTLLLSLALLLRAFETFARRHNFDQSGGFPAGHTEVAIIGILIASAFALLLAKPLFYGWCVRWLSPYIVLPIAIALCYLASFNYSVLVDLARLSIFPILIASTMLHSTTLIGRLLEWAPLRYIGRLSYSLYLWQMLFFTSFFQVPAPHSQLLHHLQTSWMRYPITLLAVLISYYLIEKPLIKIGHHLAKSVIPGREGLTPELPAADASTTQPAAHA